jgi:hypothetical protein
LLGRVPARARARRDHEWRDFRVEVGGELIVTRMAFEQGQPGEYYSVDGYRLLNGLRAAIGEQD